MPKLFGLNLVAVLAASVAFYFVGYLWYGVIFSDLWVAEMGLTAADFENNSPIWMAGGLLITIIQVIGIGLVMKWKDVTEPVGAIKTGVVLWLVFALPIVNYAYIYTPDHNSTLLMIDASHILVGWVASALVLSLIK